MVTKYYSLKCPHCGNLSSFYNYTGDITKSYKTCNFCEKKFRVHKHISKESAIINASNDPFEIGERIKKEKIKAALQDSQSDA